MTGFRSPAHPARLIELRQSDWELTGARFGLHGRLVGTYLTWPFTATLAEAVRDCGPPLQEVSVSGLLEAAQPGGPDSTVVPPEEIRFAVVLNGGVSLAVWMGGTMLELDRLVKAREEPDQQAGPKSADPIYAALLALAGCTARTDVISGTSAGGINGAALALCQVNTGAELGLLRDIWVDQGRIESLLRQPFRGAPTSLLKGDEFFLPQLNNALGLLAKPSGWREPSLAPIDLSISTTVLGGNQLVTMDSTGQALPQTLHAGRFHWARLPETPLEDDPFRVDRVERAAHRLALAARCTASFPVAFEPVFVPVNSPQHAEPDQGSKLTQEQQLRPDMAAVVQQWGNPGSAANRSRYAVDGGLLANTPTLSALKAVESMPARGPVRRVMLLVYPHAEPPRPDTAADQAAPPTVLQTVGGLLDALAGQGGRTFVDEIEAHNMFAASRRGTRSEILLTSPTPVKLERLAHELYGHYGRLRRWRTARDLAQWATRRSPTDQGLTTPPPLGWDYERVRGAADRAQGQWHKDGLPSPYVPDRVPSADTPQPTEGWGWGVSGALGVVEAATDVLRRLVWVLPRGRDYDTVREARRAVSAARTRLTELRKVTDEVWQQDSVLASLQPDEQYWRLRLAYYQRVMPGPPDTADSEAMITGLLGEIAESEAALPGASPGRRATVLATKEVLLDPEPGSAGDKAREEVLNIVRALASVRQVLDDYVGPPPPEDSPLPPIELQVLTVWRNVLFRDRRPGSDPELELLSRLLQVDIAATTLGDEVTTGATLPVELVQLSAQTPNAFAQYSHRGDDKLGGMSVNRFGGFLKRSWRVNDWTWGRVDAASTLCRVVLSPARLRRTAELSGYIDAQSGVTPADRAAETVDALVTTIFPGGLPPDPQLQTLKKRAGQELVDVLDPDVSTADLASGLPALADLFAWALHLRIVPEELPVLAGAIRADGAEGANTRSRGELFLTEHQPLLSRLDPATGRPPDEVSQQDRCAALAAFDRAGVGREPLAEEGASDQMLRTATTAAAMGATVVDSERFGLAAAKPVTRGIRGLMLLPYWTVTGLTSTGLLARGLALLGLAVGAVLLGLALFGALPEAMAAPATLIGASAVLVALTIGALRSGTLIHGLVLLTPALALLILAVLPFQQTTGAAAADSPLDPRGATTLLLVLALAAGLMVLGSLPATTGSVLAALDRLADRRNLPALSPGASGLRRLGRGLQGLLFALVGYAVPLALLAAAAWGTLWLARLDWMVVQAQLVAERSLPLVGWTLTTPVLALMAVPLGAVIAYLSGFLLQVLREEAAPQTSLSDRSAADSENAVSPSTWRYAPLTHPAGTAVGWAVFYGAGYLGVAAFVSARPDWLSQVWAQVLVLTAVLLGLVLVLVLPWALPLWALVSSHNAEMRRQARSGEPWPPPTPCGSSSRQHARATLAADLVSRGVAYRATVRPPAQPTGSPELRPLGSYLSWRMARNRRGQESGTSS